MFIEGRQPNTNLCLRVSYNFSLQGVDKEFQLQPVNCYCSLQVTINLSGHEADIFLVFDLRPLTYLKHCDSV